MLMVDDEARIVRLVVDKRNSVY